MRHRLTSTRINAKNDTGRVAYCGPYVVSAITGFSVSKIEDAIRDYRADKCDAEELIVGTTTSEVSAALEVFGFALEEVENFWHLEKKERPSVWSWMQRPRSAFAHFILAIHDRQGGHWITVKGTKICDTHTDGRWVFAADGPHRGKKIMEVYAVRPISRTNEGTRNA